MKPFDHYSPTSLPEAFELFDQLNGSGNIIAGGTDLQLKMRAGDLSPKSIVNIKQLGELQGIEFHDGRGLHLGALSTLREVCRSEAILENYPSLSHAAGLMASEQIRSFATVGGNLCNASPSADMAPPLMALDAIVVLSSKAGDRALPLEEFFTGPGANALKPGELLVRVEVPSPTGKTIFLKHSPRAFMDISVICAALRVVIANDICQEARIILGAVAPVPLRAKLAEEMLVGKPLTRDNIAAAAAIASQECSPIDDTRASASYRQRLAEVLTRRGLESFL